MNIEIDIEGLDSYDWAEVFGEGSGGNTDKTTEPVPPGSDVSSEPAYIADVEEVIAAVHGENDGEDWVGVFRLKDGRYLVAAGGCDYTGWDCQAGNSMLVANTYEEIVQFGLCEGERKRLGIPDPE